MEYAELRADGLQIGRVQLLRDEKDIDDPMTAEDYIVTLFAGGEAERYRFGCVYGDCDRHDVEAAENIAQAFGIPPSRFHALRPETAAAVRADWLAITTLARALHGELFLTGERVKQIVMACTPCNDVMINNHERIGSCLLR